MRHLFAILCLFLAAQTASILFAQPADSGGKLNLEAAEVLLGTDPVSVAPVQPTSTEAEREAAEPGAASPDIVTEDGAGTDESVAAAAIPEKPKRAFGLIAMLRAGGLIGFVICILSLVAVALAIEHALTIRLASLIPPGLPDQTLAQLNAGQWAQALKLCRENPSSFAQATAAAVAECELGWDAVEKAAEETLAEHAARLYRKIEYLNVIGNIAPMLGLLGTVVGMIYAFQELADSQGFARASDLAEGIYLALVTTVQGLVVAIPSLSVYAYFSNRVADLISETTYAVSQTLQPVKKRLLKK